MGNQNIELQKAITSIYNHLYANSEKKTPQGISKEVGKVLHTGMFIEETDGKIPAFEFTPAEIKSLSNGKGQDFAEKFVDQYYLMNKKWGIYPEDESINLKEFDICFTCKELNHVYLSDPHRDVFGDSLEIFRSQWAKQVGGQFFTDSLVTKLAMKLIKFDPREGDDLVDICSGTGGFLLAGIQHTHDLIENDGGGSNVEKKVIELAKKSIKGKEYDAEVCHIANSTIRARLGNVNDLVQQADSLDFDNFGNKSNIKFNSHKCVVGNPPFGTKITIKDSEILKNYELAKVKARQGDDKQQKVTHRAPDILFLEQNINLLIPGEGRMSLVVPYQILSGPQSHYIRKWLLVNTIITSVIDLPADTFQPHTGTKGCLLSVIRREKPLASLKKIESYKIFMSTPKWIGHDRRGNPMLKKNPDGTNSNEILTDFNDLEQAYERYTQGNKFHSYHKESFAVNIKDILDAPINQLNAQFHKPSAFSDPKNAKNWQLVKMNSVVNRIFYPGRFVRGYVKQYEGAVPFFGGKEIIQMVTRGNKWLRHDHPKIKDLSVKHGWLLVTRSGTTGVVSRVPSAWDGFAMSEHVIRIEADESKINPFYLLAYLKSDYCQEQIAKGVYGSVIDSITPDSIGSIDVLIPKDINLYNEIAAHSESSEASRNKALIDSATAQRTIDRLLNF